MKYTKDNILGLKCKHAKGGNKYMVHSFTSKGDVKLTNWEGKEPWSTTIPVTDVLSWLEKGLWVPQDVIINNYEIY